MQGAGGGRGGLAPLRGRFRCESLACASPHCLERRSNAQFARRPSPATVIATVALFIALGGAAGALPGQNKVNNGDVKDLKYKNLQLINGWGASGGSYTAAAALDAQGVVHLRGAVAQGIADGDTFAVLPGPFRPDQQRGLGDRHPPPTRVVWSSIPTARQV